MFLKRSICVFFLLVLQSVVYSQSTAPLLAEAFNKDSQELLDAYIKANDINDTAASDTTVEGKIRGVMTALFREYSSNDIETSRRYADGGPWGEEYLTVQPEVKVCFTDKGDIDSVMIRNNEVLARNFGMNPREIIWYPHKSIFRFFMSANYSDFLRVSDSTIYPSQVEKAVGDYKLIVADTSFVKGVADFLGADKDDLELHMSKVSFLDKKLKLFESQGGQVKSRPTTYTFHYSLYIDRIVFDHELESAYVQYSFRNASSEAHYELDDGKWLLKRNTDVIQY